MVMVVRVEVARRSSTPGPEFYYQYIDRNVVDITNRGGDVFTSLQVNTSEHCKICSYEYCFQCCHEIRIQG